MHDDEGGNRFKTFADSIEIIGKLGQRLNVLQADVVAIENLQVDDNGDAEAVVSANTPTSSQIGLRLPPSAMLLAKSEEIARVVTSLKAEFGKILHHADQLTARCKLPPLESPPPQPNSIDLNVLEQMTHDMQREINQAPPSPLSDAPDQKTSVKPQSRPRIGPPRLRDAFHQRHPVSPAVGSARAPS
jgi:hypothetical protein